MRNTIFCRRTVMAFERIGHVTLRSNWNCLKCQRTINNVNCRTRPIRLYTGDPVWRQKNRLLTNHQSDISIHFRRIMGYFCLKKITSRTVRKSDPEVLCGHNNRWHLSLCKQLVSHNSCYYQYFFFPFLSTYFSIVWKKLELLTWGNVFIF